MKYGVKLKKRGKTMKYRFITSLFLLLAILTISSSSKVNIGDELIVNFSTDKITLLAGNSKIIPFTILNNSTGSIRIADITVSGDTDFQINKMILQSYELESMKMIEGSFEIMSSETINSTGQLSLIVKYELFAPGTLTPITYIKYFPIEYEIITYPNIDELIEVKIHSEDNFIYEGNFKNIILEIRNISSTPIVVDQISFLNSSYIDAYPDSCVLDPKTIDDQCVPNSLLPSSNTLMPGQNSLFPIYLKLSESYPHRNIQSIFTINITFIWGKIQISEKLNSEYTITAGSFEGEKEILNIIGIPIFLLFPGFFFITILIFLWKNLYKKEPLDDKFFKNPVFWVFTIVMSIVLLTLYKSITRYYGSSRDILTGFNLNDIVNLSIGSILFGALIAFLCICTNQIFDLKYPNENDNPKELLVKLFFYNQGFKLERFITENCLFFYIKKKRNENIFWYSPQINISVSNNLRFIKLCQLLLLSENHSVWNNLIFLWNLQVGMWKQEIFIKYETKSGIRVNNDFNVLKYLQEISILNIKQRILPGRIH